MYLKDKIADLTEVTLHTFTPDLRGLIAWLETQPGKTSYPWQSYDDCLLCRFASALNGSTCIWGGVQRILGIDATCDNMPLTIAAYGHNYKGPKTYAAALKRARKQLTA